MLLFDISIQNALTMLCDAASALRRLKFLHQTWRLLTDLDVVIAKPARDR